MPNTTIPAAGEAMPAISKIILGTVHAETEHRFTIRELAGLSMEELQALIDLLATLDEVTCAFLNQPRFASGRIYNKAGELGDEIGTHLSACIAMVEQVAIDAAPTNPKQAKARAWMLLQRAAHYSDDLPTFVTAAAQLSVSASKAEEA